MRRLIVVALAVLVASAGGAQDKWFLARTDQATLESVSATSELVEAQFAGKFLYPPINIFDGNFETTWCEAEAGGPGLGETITITFAEPVSFDAIELVNGLVQKGDYYHKNNRVAKLTITQVAGEHFQQKQYELKDNSPTWQRINFALPQTARTISLRIDSVYKGTRFDDTCLSDFRLLWQGKPIPVLRVAELRTIQETFSRELMKADRSGFAASFKALFQGKELLFLQGPDGVDGYMLTLDSRALDSGEDDGLVNNITPAVFQKPLALDKYQAWLQANNIGAKEIFLPAEDYEPANLAAQVIIPYPRMAYKPYPGYHYPLYEIGTFRLVVREAIDYVETASTLLVKLDGTKGVYLNGVYYRVVPANKVAWYQTYNFQ